MFICELNGGDSLTFTLSDVRQSILSPSTIAIEWTDGKVWVAVMKVRKAIIPAAGLGTRFLPATKAIA